MNRPIIIAPSYLDPNCAVGQIERHFFENLNDFEPFILCQPGECSLMRNCHYELIAESYLFKQVERILRNLHLGDFLRVPDYMRFSWGQRALSAALKALDKREFSYIHSISIPCSSHLVGLELKRRTGLPWIAQFYDPWHNNPTRKYKFNFLRDYDHKLERSVAINADIIIHSNQIMIDDWINAYGDIVRDKILLLPYVTHVDNLGQGGEKQTDSRFIITHVGSFQSFRESSVFIKAVRLLVEQHPELRDKFIVKYVGRVTNKEKGLISNYNLEDLFVMGGYKREEECFPFFEEADLFLAIDTNHDHNVFFPSKLLKYFLYKKPILGLVQKESVLRDELNKSNNFIFEYDDFKGVAEFLFQAICNRSSINTNDKTYWEKFSLDKVLPAYKEIVRKL